MARRVSRHHGVSEPPASSHLPIMRVITVPALLEQLPLEAGVAIVRDGASTIVSTEPAHVRVAHGADGFRALDEIEHEGGWWAGYLAYDLGRAVERVVPWAAADRSIPDVVLARYDARVRFTPGLEPVIEGGGPARRRLEAAMWSALRSREDEPARRARPLDLEPRPGRLRRRGEGDPRPPRRRRVLPGEPDPPALRAAGRRPACALLRARPAEPRTAPRAAHVRPRSPVLPRRRLRVARAVPGATRRSRRRPVRSRARTRIGPRWSAARRTAPST